MPISNVASISNFISDVFEDAVFVARARNLMSGLVTTYSMRGWNDRKLSIYPSLTAQDVGEGEDFAAAEEWNKNDLATLHPGEIMTQVIITDRRLQTDPQDARRDAAVEMGNALATRVDTDLIEDMASFTGGTIGAAGSALTLLRCAAAVANLQGQKAMPPYYGVVHPFGWFNVWVELGRPAPTNAFLGDVANQAMKDYTVGQFVGAQWFQSNNVPINVTDDAVSGVFNREALALDVREAPTLEPERDASLRAWELNLHEGYAHGVRRSEYGVKITYDASTPTGN